MVDLTYRQFPHPAFEDRLILNKPPGMGWNNLGRRRPYAVVLHRMIGSLNGTDAFFRDPNVRALTDYGIGVEAMDGKPLAGVIYRWVDPTGHVTPWASGPVKEPYGDGLCFIRKFGHADAANKNAVSIELSGRQDTPIDDVAYAELVKLCAYWCDQMRVPYDQLTNSPWTGCSTFIWHEEFTFGTGKRCPFDVVKALTPQLIADTSAALVPYQTAGMSAAEEDDPLAELPKSDAALDTDLIWPNASEGPVGELWRQYGEATASWGSPGQPWNEVQPDGSKLFVFSNGLAIAVKDGKAGLVVKSG